MEKWSNWRKICYRFFEKELETRPNDSNALDLGSGKRSYLNPLTSRFQTFHLDKEKYDGVIQSDLNVAMKFDDKVADIIILSNILEHIKEPNVLISECARVLKDDGVILGAIPFLVKLHQLPDDYHRYTKNNLEYLFEKHGMTTDIETISDLRDMYRALLKAMSTNLIGRIFYRISLGLHTLFNPSLTNSNPIYPTGYLFKAYKNKKVD